MLRHGGVRAVARAAGVSETTVRKGVFELEDGEVERPGLGGGPDTWKGEGLWHPRGSTPLSCVNARSGWSLNCVS
ncbi:hypothetical protein E1281_39845, partial [Actinomadura sp. KC345]